VTALVVLAAREGMINTPLLRGKALEALERLYESGAPASSRLRLALAWGNIVQSDPQVERAKTLASDAVRPTEVGTGIPAREVNSMQQVRTLYQELRAVGRSADAIRLLSDIANVREEERTAERDELRGQRLARSIGVELAALACLAAEHQVQNDRWQAIQTLDRYEALLLAYEDTMEPGFVTSDWLEIGRLSLDLGLPWAALRRADRGLRIDSERSELRELRDVAFQQARLPAKARLVAELSTLGEVIEAASIGAIGKVADLEEHLRACAVLELEAPMTWTKLWQLLGEVQHLAETTSLSEESVNQALAAARAELPQEALGSIEATVTWLSDMFGPQQVQLPLQLEIYDETIWPRSVDTEACALIVMTCTTDEALDLQVIDRRSGSLVWHGSLEPGRPAYRRWIFENEDGFIPDEQIDIELEAHVNGGKHIQFPITVAVGTSEPSWPDYPAGSLHPSEVPGGDLYGRGQLIRQIVSSFGPTRSRANYLVESVRQMGKTTLLFFIKTAVPDHVLPVYVDLERMENEPERNIWNYVAEQIMREVGREVDQPIQRRRHSDIVNLSQDICSERGKAYVLLLMDELHVLLRDEKYARNVLTELRADLNQPTNRIAVLFADRYTLHESEMKVPSEIWLQLNELRLGPLDQESTESAIRVPCQHRDANFLKETIDEIYAWTNGYPFHVQRLVQNIIELNFRGPWVTALPEDVSNVVPRLVEQDSLFRAGVCRPERIDAEIQCAVAAYLEYEDLRKLLPCLSSEEEWKGTVESFSPQPAELLMTFGDPAKLLTRLESVGLMRRIPDRHEQYELFSPLLERWLRRMRDEHKPLYEGGPALPWRLSVRENVAGMSKEAWLQLDGEVASVCPSAPLRPKAYTGSWDQLVGEANSREAFQAFCQAASQCFVEKRAEPALMRYPWLYLAYHRTRLVRNYFHHIPVTRAAAEAWRQVCTRALGGNFGGDEPKNPEEWRAVQLVVLRTLEIGLRNAIAMAKGADRTGMSG
jgi:hypothetical protein